MKAELLGTVPGCGPLKGRVASAVELVTLDAEIVALIRILFFPVSIGHTQYVAFNNYTYIQSLKCIWLYILIHFIEMC